MANHDVSAAPTKGTASNILLWSFKSSFVDYVFRLIDGKIVLSDGASQKLGAFAFPAASSRLPYTTTSLPEVQFVGAVTFAAHGGALQFSLRNPGIVSTAEGSIITMADPHNPTERVDLAVVMGIIPTIVDGRVIFDAAEPQLTARGVELLGNFYKPGSLLDPIVITSGKERA